MQPLLAIGKTQEKTDPITPPVIEYVEEPPPGEPAEGEAAPPPPHGE